MKTIRLTMAQALVRALAAQWTELEGQRRRLFSGVWAIFGHGNVAGLGEALYETREVLPVLRAHNEQAMAHAAVGFAKASRRRRMMACTTSIGPGATNLVTAAAVAHVNRLPLLLLPGDAFASRAPDPVLQQLEDFGREDTERVRPYCGYVEGVRTRQAEVTADVRWEQHLLGCPECRALVHACVSASRPRTVPDPEAVWGRLRDEIEVSKLAAKRSRQGVVRSQARSTT